MSSYRSESKLKLRWALISGAFAAYGLAGCAHQTPTVRAPSSTEIEASQYVRMVQTYQNSAAHQAFLITGPDADGVRRAVCQIGVAARDRLVPSFISVDQTSPTRTFGLPECHGEQLEDISRVALEANRPVYAGAGKAISTGVICAIDFGFSFALTAASNYASNRLADRKSGRVRGLFVGAQTAGGLVVSVGVAAAAKVVQPRRPLIQAGLVGVGCTAGGVTAGYLLIPPR